MMSARPFPFRVRPRHLETVGSLTRRVLAVNGEPGTLPQRLLAERGLAPGDWPTLLHAMNRSTRRAAATPQLTHRDGSTCPQCMDLVTKRWMCTLCAHGDLVEQEPHFGSPVCPRHGRWVGFTDAPTAQHTVPDTAIRAGGTFTRLLRRHRLDAGLYWLIEDAVVTARTCDEAAAFPLTVGIIAAVTNPAFLRRVLSPVSRFQDAYRHVAGAVTEVLGAENRAVTRTVWLAMRPAFAAVHAAAKGQPFQAHPHDFPVPADLVSAFPAVEVLEPFGAFLLETGDTVESAARTLAATHARLDPASRQRFIICAHGHEYSTRNADASCPQCPRGDAARYGLNDLTTVAPHLVAEWDSEANGGVTPAMVPASSHRRYHWRCAAKNHPYLASPSNRTQTGADCPVCLNRTIVPGVNDFATRFPKAFAELHPSDAHGYNPHRNTPRSDKLARWVCQQGHTFKARFVDRAQGSTCPECKRLRAVERTGSLADFHPALAAEWVIGEDGRTPADFSPGSSYEATWRCSKGHEYAARIERRVKGKTRCPYCSRRRVLLGFNDLATTHPQLTLEWDQHRNLMSPTEVLAGSIAKREWVCRNGHVTVQSIPHRITSGGCTLCPPAERALRSASPLVASLPSRLAPELTQQESSDPTPEVEDLIELIRRLYCPGGFANDTIVDAWAEAAGFTEAHPEPSMLLSRILEVVPNLSSRGVPPVSDVLEGIDELASRSDTLLPPSRLLARATYAALRVIEECDGPYETDREFADALIELTRR